MNDDLKLKIINILEEENQIGKKFDFKRFFVELVKYRKEHKNLLVPALYIVENSKTVEKYKLGYYVQEVRRAKHALENGEKPRGYILTDNQYEVLNLIGFKWSARRTFDLDRFYKELVIFRKRHGHVLVPLKYESTDLKTGEKYKLGYYVHGVRNSKRQMDRNEKQDCFIIDEDFVKKLNALGFDWKTKDYVRFKGGLVK